MKRTPSAITFTLAVMSLVLAATTLDRLFLAPGGGSSSDSVEASSSPVKNPTIERGELGAPTDVEEYRFFELPNGLDKAQIHEIVFHEGAMWLGTDRGLVKIVDRDVTVYRQFSDWPFEWVRNLAVTPYGIAVSVHVALGNTGGQRANSHLFGIEDETWREIGSNVLAQAWHGRHLYQASSRLIRRDPKEDWHATVVDPSICGRRPSDLKIKVASNELWIVGKGTVLEGSGRRHISRSVGCGVIRHTPSTGRSLVYDTTHGVNNDYGWDLDGDEGEILVSHSVKHNKLSRFDIERGRWSTSRKGGSGNRLALSSDGVWLARGVAATSAVSHGSRDGSRTVLFHRLRRQRTSPLSG